MVVYTLNLSLESQPSQMPLNNVLCKWWAVQNLKIEPSLQLGKEESVTKVCQQTRIPYRIACFFLFSNLIPMSLWIPQYAYWIFIRVKQFPYPT